MLALDNFKEKKSRGKHFLSHHAAVEMPPRRASFATAAMALMMSLPLAMSLAASVAAAAAPSSGLNANGTFGVGVGGSSGDDDASDHHLDTLDTSIGHGLELGANGTTATYALRDDERAGLGKLFEQVDADGDGGVDLPEFFAFLEELASGDEALTAAIRGGGGGGASDSVGSSSSSSSGGGSSGGGDSSSSGDGDGDAEDRGSGGGGGGGDDGGEGSRTNEPDERAGTAAAAKQSHEQHSRNLGPLQVLFRAEDGDGDGALSRAEFQAALVAWAAEMSAGAARGVRENGADEEDEEEAEDDDEDEEEERRRRRLQPRPRRPSSSAPASRPSAPVGPRAPPWRDYAETHGRANSTSNARYLPLSGHPCLLS